MDLDALASLLAVRIRFVLHPKLTFRSLTLSYILLLADLFPEEVGSEALREKCRRAGASWTS